jgi:hypothetical protein
MVEERANMSCRITVVTITLLLSAATVSVAQASAESNTPAEDTVCIVPTIADDLRLRRLQPLKDRLAACESQGGDSSSMIEAVVAAALNIETIDPSMAAEFYAVAVARVHVRATALLGYAYLNGNGVRQSDAQAFNYFTQAAAQGNAAAQANLGLLYEKGRGGAAKSVTEARRYYEAAAASGLEYAKMRLERLAAVEPPTPTPPAPAARSDELVGPVLVNLRYSEDAVGEWKTELAAKSCSRDARQPEFIVESTTRTRDGRLTSVPGTLTMEPGDGGILRFRLFDPDAPETYWEFEISSRVDSVVIPRHHGECPDAIGGVVTWGSQSVNIDLVSYSRHCVCERRPSVFDGGFHPSLSLIERSEVILVLKSNVQDAVARIIGSSSSKFALPRELSFVEGGPEYVYIAVEKAGFRKVVEALRWQWDGRRVTLHLNGKQYRARAGSKITSLPPIVLIPN